MMFQDEKEVLSVPGREVKIRRQKRGLSVSKKPRESEKRRCRCR